MIKLNDKAMQAALKSITSKRKDYSDWQKFLNLLAGQWRNAVTKLDNIIHLRARDLDKLPRYKGRSELSSQIYTLATKNLTHNVQKLKHAIETDADALVEKLPEIQESSGHLLSFVGDLTVYWQVRGDNVEFVVSVTYMPAVYDQSFKPEEDKIPVVAK